MWGSVSTSGRKSVARKVSWKKARDTTFRFVSLPQCDTYKCASNFWAISFKPLGGELLTALPATGNETGRACTV
jgi:hypothetical protein